MNGGAGGSTGGGVAGARVPIPSSLRKTIQDIKEIADGKHSDDDIYALLKECSMDPNEAAQRLLYLDTFHEVKRKRNKKKVDIGRASEGYRWDSSMLRGGSRGGRENYSSYNVNQDFGGRRKASARHENGFSNYSERSSRRSEAVIHKRENNSALSVLNSSTSLIRPKNVSNGSFRCEAKSQISSDNTSDASKFGSGNGMSGKVPPLPAVAVDQPPKPGPAEALPGYSSERVTPASVSVVYSSSADPLLVPPLAPQHPASVGTKEEENGTPENASQSVKSVGGVAVGQFGEKRGQAASDSTNSSSTGGKNMPQGSKSRLLSEAPSGLSLKTCSGSPADLSSLDNPHAKQVIDPSKGQTMPEIDKKLEQLSVSTHRPVIFPDHLQVPEALRKGLTFGSVDATLGQSADFEKVSSCVGENISATYLTTRDASHSNHCALPIDKEGENSNCPPSDPQVAENLSTLGYNASSDPAPNYDQSEQHMLAPTVGSQFPNLQTAPEYSFGFIPPVLNPHIVHLEAAETQSGNPTVPSTSGSTRPVTQTSGLDQNANAVPTQFHPFLRQPYPPNFIPYNPYFPQLYMPHNGHQFLGHNVLPQQPIPGNMYVTPAGSKFAVPQYYKTATPAGNIPHFGIASAYGSHGALSVGYNPSPAFTSGDNEDLAAPELKENNLSALKQNEESHTWTPSRDLSTSPVNYFYNIPPGQHVAISPAHPGHGAFAGMYHLNSFPPTLTAQSLQPSSLESEVPTPNYQQPHARHNWNNKLLNRDNI